LKSRRRSLPYRAAAEAVGSKVERGEASAPKTMNSAVADEESDEEAPQYDEASAQPVSDKKAAEEIQDEPRKARKDRKDRKDKKGKQKERSRSKSKSKSPRRK
jgi:hypothetical protein